jgi:sulfite reductase alpha subunit-like flavoprotein
MLSLASIPLPIGQVGVILLALSFIAAFLVSYLDRVRKYHSSKGVSSATKSNRCTVIYGTQTGTAERFAKSLKSQLESKYGGSTQVEVVDAETYIGEEQLPHEQLIFFIMATQGDGEPTDNATAFYNWLVDVADNSGGETLCKVRLFITPPNY